MTIYHQHHIIPVHMGGTDHPDNLVEVSVEKHAELHKQLWEDLGHWQDYVAWQGLSGRIGKEDMIRLRCSLGGKIGGKKLKGKSKSQEHRRKLAIASQGDQNHSDESIQRMRKALTGSNSNLAKIYRFIDPFGVEHKVLGLNDFCRRNGLQQSCMCGVAKGLRKQHKGWKRMNDSLS
jgi:hypothetical protein